MLDSREMAICAAFEYLANANTTIKAMTSFHLRIKETQEEVNFIKFGDSGVLCRSPWRQD